MLAPFILALATVAPQTDGLLEVLVRDGQSLMYQGSAMEIRTLRYPRIGRGGGWISEARTPVLPAPTQQRIIIGQRPSQVGGPAEVLRVPATIGSAVQRNLYRPVMANGQIAYIASLGSDQFLPVSVWIDQQMILEAGDMIPGENFRWTRFEEVRLAIGGTALIAGRGRDLVTLDLIDLVMEWPSMQVVLREGRQPQGSPLYVHDLDEGSLFMSPNGEHWAVSVILSSSPTANGFTDALVTDGAVHDLGNGYLLQRGMALPAELLIEPTLGPWWRFREFAINDAGEFAFNGAGYHNNMGWSLTVRNGVALSGPDSLDTRRVMGIDAEGLVLTRGPAGTELLVENDPVYDELTGVDIDRDGIADPSWSVRELVEHLEPGPQGLSLSYASLREAGVFSSSLAILRGPDYRIDRPTCNGVPNSTGRAGRIVASGNRTAGTNDLTLQAYSLPLHSIGFFLLSQTPGVVLQPGGSQGNLCLGGTIGRLSQQVFMTATSGTGAAQVDLTAIPQPSGSTAASAGQVWFAQAWYRDQVGGQATSNFTGATAVSFN